MSIIKKYLIPILLLIIILFILIRSYSFNLALTLSGYPSDSINYFQRSYNASGDEFMVINSLSNENDIAIIHLIKNKLGFWNIATSVDIKDSKTGITSYGWTQTAGAQRYNFELNASVGWEYHRLYCGTNANKLIKFRTGQLPENVTVNIQQAGNLYFIHLISFADLDIINSLDIPGILLENGSITND